MKKYAVIVAGGTGTRMGSAIPKQFHVLLGRPILWHTLEVFLAAYDDLQVNLVLPGEHMETGLAVAGATRAPDRIRLVAGGENRFYSVRNGLALVDEDSVIAVHDGVRCLVGMALVRSCFGQAARLGSAVPVVGARDSVRLLTEKGSEAVDRNRVKLVQTPQTFIGKILLPAFKVEYRDEFTDEATVVEAAGHAVHLIEGDVNNIKITLPPDLLLAERLMQGF